MMELLLTINVKKGEEHEQDYDHWAGFGKKCISCSVLGQAWKGGQEENPEAIPGTEVFCQPASMPSGHGGMRQRPHWARKLDALGHQVKLMQPQYVKPYAKWNKNNYNDALANVEAVTRQEMCIVSAKPPNNKT
jgi:hypothetical protein